MADVSDVEKAVKEAREFALSNNGIDMNIRIFDGTAQLLVEVIRELRRLNENLEK